MSSNTQAPQSTIPCNMEPSIIPSSAAQRTFERIGRSLKSVLTTKVPARLTGRKKVERMTGNDSSSTRPVHTPPKLDPKGLSTEKPLNPRMEGAAQGIQPILATVFPEDVHANLVTRGIKVRDFAYAPNRVGHTNPTLRHPMAFEENTKGEKEKKCNEIPVCPEQAPMPSISTTWQEPHPCLRPIPKTDWQGACAAPSLDKSYQPVFAAHCIPTLFNPAIGVAEIDYRLSQTPRTVPIMGITTRRLLTLSPHLVDLARYHEMDLEELRRYDRRIVWRLMNDIEPYPWKSIIEPGWKPTTANRALMAKCGEFLGQWENLDQQLQCSLLGTAEKKTAEDDAWMDQHLLQVASENRAKGLLDPGADLGALGVWDIPLEEEEGVSARQLLAAWARRLESTQALQAFPVLLARLRMLCEHDGRADDDAEWGDMAVWKRKEELYADTTPPFLLGQQRTHLPPLPYWGPNAVWDNYRLYGGTPTGKTLNEYAAELSTCKDTSSWPVGVTRTDALYCTPILNGNPYLNITPTMRALEELAARRAGTWESESESDSDSESRAEECGSSPGLKRKLNDVAGEGEEERLRGPKRARRTAPHAAAAADSVPSPSAPSSHKRGIEKVEWEDEPRKKPEEGLTKKRARRS
ncbi:hypothetical protein GGX14DRAFT_465918 [Mycena pura]|uniref:Uncharacterized protein n=1 Tax=Mycena pura TaxID=153505 RepID=A0AAD6V6K8_9AGAR|nr:hypothetical protein GGX14DRAFT_465918 [Mycena pura]